jgi:hypothetical protein
MNNNLGLTWTCHICLEERLDAYISVLVKPLIFDGRNIAKQNIRYCNDRPKCYEGAYKFSFLKLDSTKQI